MSRIKLDMPWVPENTRRRWEFDLYRYRKRWPHHQRPDTATLESINPEWVFRVIEEMGSPLQARHQRIGYAMGLTRPRCPQPSRKGEYGPWESGWYCGAVRIAIKVLRQQGRIELVGHGYIVAPGLSLVVTGREAG